MAIIDLGEVTAAPAPGDGARSVRLRDVRWVVLSALGLVVMLLLGGSAVPVRRSLVELWRLPVNGTDQFTLTADRLYLRRLGSAEPGLDAYAAKDGRRLWRIALPEAPSWLGTQIPGLLLVPTSRQEPDGNLTVQDTIALDAATGETRWRRRGDVLGLQQSATPLLLAEWDQEGGRITAVTRVRPSDGAQVWRFEPPEPVDTMAATATGLLTVTADGRVEIRDLDRLTLRQTGRLPWRPIRTDENTHAYLEVLGERFFAVRIADGTMEVNGYDIATLRPTWRWSGPSESGFFPCGELACVGDDAAGIQALDPATGVVRWRSEGWNWGFAIAGGLLFAESHRGNGQGIIDPATGRRVVSFPPGTSVIDPGGRHILQLTLTTESPPRNAVWELRPDHTLLLRGALTRLGDPGCQLAAGRLACLNYPLDPPRPEISVTAVS